MKFKKEEAGFTYVEIVVSLCIISFIVGPLCYAFLAIKQTQKAAQELKEAIHYGEHLLSQVEEQVDRDRLLSYKVKGRLVSTKHWNEEKITKAKEGIGQYLLSCHEAGEADRKNLPIKEWIKETEGMLYEQTYQTERFAYEVAIWHEEDIPLDHGEFVLNNEALEKATKFYMDKAHTFKLEEKEEEVVRFKFSEEALKRIEAKPLFEHTIVLHKKAGHELSYTLYQEDEVKAVVSSASEIYDGCGKKWGYHWVVDEAEGSILSGEREPVGVIRLDLRELLRNEDLEEITDFDHYTFKITNHSPYDQVICVEENIYYERSQDPIEDAKRKKAAIEKIHQKFNVIVQDQGTGKSVVCRRCDKNREEGYLIVVLVRAKSPVQGEDGRVIKWLIDFHE